MREGKGSKWKAALDDPTAKLWYDSMRLQSDGMAQERLRVLVRYCGAMDTTPAGLAAKAQTTEGRRAVEAELQAFLIHLHDEGKSPGYISNFVKATKAWLRHNDVALVRKFSVGDPDAIPTIEGERVPTPDELQTILKDAGLRGRVIVSFLAFTGIRPEVLGTRGGVDGLYHLREGHPTRHQ